MFKDSIADMITTIGNVFPVQDIRVYCDGSEEVDGRFSTPLDLLPMDIDPTITPRFAFGPPLFSDFASQSQLLDQLYFGPPSITVTYSKLREMVSDHCIAPMCLLV
jgi:hypothetical protein